MEWKVRGIRGATTVKETGIEAIKDAVTELLDAMETQNKFDSEDIICVFFTVTSDLNSIFPAAIARHRQDWDKVPLLDLQQMYVPGSLERCIRVLIQVNTQKPQSEIIHCYMRNAEKLRPDLSLKGCL